MDGIHDLGGKQGFGRIDVGEPNEPFHAPWEARSLAINKAITSAPDWTIDRWRFTRECIEPTDYLTRPYFDQWMQIYAALLVDSGIATVDELVAGRSATGSAGLGEPMRAADVIASNAVAKRFDSKEGPAPAYAVGSRVRTTASGATGHTRLPAYLRGRSGTIFANHGAHVLPDTSAHGNKHYEPLYTIAFATADLWPEAAGSKDSVRADLWESYLVPA